MQRVVSNDLDSLLLCLPPRIAEAVQSAGHKEAVLEVVLDLGRPPEVRFPGSDIELGDTEVTHDDIQSVIDRIGTFGGDNRAGIERTLNRISAIRNRSGSIVGLTCRVGRAVYGSMDLIRDIVEQGQSILLLGRPGVGKTTMLREVARVLANDLHKRVIIVDTSNEIAGDSDIPHPAIGRARRMQVASPQQQHAVMIEAVENHMPEVIVIDEIGTEMEAAAARTIAERGVQLIGTAHGNTLENLILNPTLSDLVGGVQVVTLGDDEARRRGTQKTVLERKSPPTFHCVVEIQSWDKVVVHPDVGEVVDELLRGNAPRPEIRFINESQVLVSERPEPLTTPVARQEDTRPADAASLFAHKQPAHCTRLYPYGVSHSRLEQAVHELGVNVEVVRDLGHADAVLTLKTHYRRKPAPLRIAENRGIPIYVLRSNTLLSMQQLLANMLDLDEPPDEVTQAIQEAEEAIESVRKSGRKVELNPQNAYVRLLQHQLAERNRLASRSRGKEPHRRVQIFEDGLS